MPFWAFFGPFGGRSCRSCGRTDGRLLQLLPAAADCRHRLLAKVLTDSGRVVNVWRWSHTAGLAADLITAGQTDGTQT